MSWHSGQAAHQSGNNGVRIRNCDLQTRAGPFALRVPLLCVDEVTFSRPLSVLAKPKCRCIKILTQHLFTKPGDCCWHILKQRGGWSGPFTSPFEVFSLKPSPPERVRLAFSFVSVGEDVAVILCHFISLLILSTWTIVMSLTAPAESTLRRSHRTCCMLGAYVLCTSCIHVHNTPMPLRSKHAKMCSLPSVIQLAHGLRIPLGYRTRAH